MLVNIRKYETRVGEPPMAEMPVKEVVSLREVTVFNFGLRVRVVTRGYLKILDSEGFEILEGTNGKLIPGDITYERRGCGQLTVQGEFVYRIDCKEEPEESRLDRLRRI